MEELLGVKVFVRGNEISLDTRDEAKYHLFQHMIEQLEEFVRIGQAPEQDIIRAIFHALDTGKHKDAELLKKSAINIPGALKKVFPKSYNQAMYLDAIDRHDVIFAVGPAGTGKTYLAVAKALAAVQLKTFKRLVVTRPVVEAGESLGFLPGDLTQKINPYLRPIYDSMFSLLAPEGVKKLEENNQIEIAPLAYMRGRTLADSIIILDEAQNTSREQMKMLLTRLGLGSKIICTGDVTQIDIPRKKESGMLHAISLMKSIPEIAIVFFNEHDVVRHPLVRKIVKAYETDTPRQ
ncbi:MAG: PhoH family protein [Spirochaetaceae bacterium]|nr:MAG: PhoH family protein [Spirochaetaceae bacterium]